MDLGSVLKRVETFLRRFIVFAKDHQAVAVALWVAHTHAIEAADATPYLNVHSPVKRSGKTTLLDVLDLLVCSPMPVSNVTEAALFRSIEQRRPTLLFDEVDAIFAARTGNESLRGLLNAGHRRGRKVVRMGGPKMTEVQEFDTFCPKALAGIGRLPDTVGDRSIPIQLTRRKRSEQIERFRYADAVEASWPIQRALIEWAGDPAVIETLRTARPELPGINDRAADGWEPLLAIAEAASGAWPARARAAAETLHSETDVDDDGQATRLLADIHLVFAEAGADRMSTSALVDALIEIDGAPWAERWARTLRDDPQHKAAGSKLARMLRQFGITSTKIRTGSETFQGYRRADFEDVWERYVSRAFEPSRPDEQNDGTPQVDGPTKGAEVPTEPVPDQACSVVPSSRSEHAISVLAITDQPNLPAAAPARPAFDVVETLAAIAAEEARGYTDEVIGVLMATAGRPAPRGFKGWTGYAVRTVRGMQ